MLFTRTIRRKLLAGLFLVLSMLLALSYGGLAGLRSYRRVVKDLELSINQAPRSADLIEAIAPLSQPLLREPPAGPESRLRDFQRRQQQEFARRLREAESQISEFHRRLDALPPTDTVVANQPLTAALLQSLQQDLDYLKGIDLFPADPVTHAELHQNVIKRILKLTHQAQEIPGYQDGLNQKLRQARAEYRAHLRLVAGSSVLAVALFLGLGIWAYAGIFSPLKQLHEGARRVAQGHFDYRLQLKSRDEMAELAEAFNLMTIRFQEIKTDLDRQVRERSKQLVRSERLAGIGFLAAGVAHEINNPLSAISMAAESLLERSREQSPADKQAQQVQQEYLEMIQRETAHCRTITAKLLDFARGQGEQRCRTDLTDLVEDVVSLVSHMSKFRDLRIEFSHREPCYLEINGPEIKQVVLNIVANAMESMVAGGTLAIELLEQTDQVILKFQDQGCGMSRDVLENLFDPFFTRGKAGTGTGLGMAISQRIIGDHQGTIEADSPGPGQGSTFLVHLPRTATAQGAVAA